MVEPLVSAIAEKNGVPGEAVLFRLEGPQRYLVDKDSVTSKWRPVPGGVLIEYARALGIARCTLGFNAQRGGRTDTLYFLTASHCSDIEGSVENEVYYQNSSSAGLRIGVEILDPPFYGSSIYPECPATKTCRYVDVLLARYDDTSWGTLGQIARTVDSASGQYASLDVNPAGRVFNVTAERRVSVQGELLHKVGITTGWTYGLVLDTCKDWNASSSQVILCQSTFGGGGDPGDSGAPIFAHTSDNSVRIHGIVFAQSGPDTYFSTLAYIEEAFGNLTATYPP